jgi:hypothetical protein
MTGESQAFAFDRSHAGSIEPEYETLHRATRTLIDALNGLFHPALAEYVATTNAIKILETYHISLQISPSVAFGVQGPDERLLTGHSLDRAEHQLQGAAAQLIRLRGFCNREGLVQSLGTIDQELGLYADTIER